MCPNTPINVKYAMHKPAIFFFRDDQLERPTSQPTINAPLTHVADNSSICSISPQGRAAFLAE